MVAPTQLAGQVVVESRSIQLSVGALERLLEFLRDEHDLFGRHFVVCAAAGNSSNPVVYFQVSGKLLRLEVLD